MLSIRLTKHLDGRIVLSCTRDDGSTTWQKQRARHAAFFALHDLTHLAVETELQLHDAFFGLIGSGWSIEDTEGKSARGPIPPNAIFAETIVGMLDMERASANRWTAAEFNDNLARQLAKAGRTPPRLLTDDELARIRKRRAELIEQWNAVQDGESLDVTFAT